MNSKIKSDANISLGKNIKNCRIKHGFSQAYMVREMQLKGCYTTKQNYSKYEKDKAHISATEIVVIAELLDTSINSFFQILKIQRFFEKRIFYCHIKKFFLHLFCQLTVYTCTLQNL